MVKIAFSHGDKTSWKKRPPMAMHICNAMHVYPAGPATSFDIPARARYPRNVAEAVTALAMRVCVSIFVDSA